MNELENVKKIFEDLQDEQDLIDDRLISYAEDNPEVKKLISKLDEMNNTLFDN